MKPQFYPGKIFIATVLLLCVVCSVQAQVCTNAVDTMYSLSTTGVLHPININTAVNGPNLDSLQAKAGVPPLNANGMGYSTLNGKFYYFERSNTGTTPFQTFVSYNPATKQVDSLAIPAAIGDNKIRSGCVNNAGTGYYTIDPAFSGSTASLQYYSIASNTWTQITTNFDSLGGAANSLNGVFHNLNSGDMAFDGNGNLWILCSSGSNYGLYRVPAPVPTTTVTRINAIKQIIPSTTATPVSGFSFTGLAFNSTGSLYLCTGNGNNRLYRLTTTSASSLTLIGTFPKNDVGGDLTSCSTPNWVLASSPWQSFTATLRNGIDLDWNTIEAKQTTGYEVQYSHDGINWERHAFLSGSSSHHYTDKQYVTGDNYFRIVQHETSGKTEISPVKLVTVKHIRSIAIGPNPANNVLQVHFNGNSGNYLAQVFDRSGRLLQSGIVSYNSSSVNVAMLQKGNYVLRLTNTTSMTASSIQFVK